MADLAGYRRVNYYELCRLCTSSEGTKMHIFREEGRRRSLPNKIQTCLPLTVHEDDSLPKIICMGCVEKLEGYYEFRESCINAEAMLESYFTSLKYSDDLSREGKVSVYVKEDPGGVKKKDEPANAKTKQPPVLQPVSMCGGTSGSSSVTTITQNTAPHVTTAAHQTQHENNMQHVPSTIQILTDQDGNRLAQYKVHVQGGVPSLVPTYSSLQLPIPLHQLKAMHMTHDDTQTNQSEQVAQQSMMASVTIAPQNNADLFSRFHRPAMQDIVKMKNISIIDTSGATIEPGMAQIRLDPEQINQLMSGSGLQLSLSQITKPKQEDQEVQIKESIEVIDERGDPLDITEMDGQLHETTQAESGSQETVMFECDMCDKIFRRKEHLLQHKKSHTGQRPFICAYCNKAFSRKEHLIRHKVSHTGQKMYTCDVCQKNFSRKDNLHKHKKTHGINGPHVCETCGKSFVVKHYYVLHRASHEKEGQTAGATPAAGRTSQFRCDLCSKVYSSQINLDTHRLRHKNKEKERIKVEQRLQNQQQQQQQQQQPTSQSQQTQQPTILTSFPINTGLATINPHALLTPGIVHSSANVVQIGTSYVCSSDLLDQYRRLHS